MSPMVGYATMWPVIVEPKSKSTSMWFQNYTMSYEQENDIHENEQVFMNCKMVNCEKIKHKPVSRKSKKRNGTSK